MNTRIRKILSAKKQQEYDLGLAVLCAIRRPNQTFTQVQIAAACNVSQGAIYLIEKKTFKKVCNALFRMGLKSEAFNFRKPKS